MLLGVSPLGGFNYNTQGENGDGRWPLKTVAETGYFYPRDAICIGDLKWRNGIR